MLSFFRANRGQESTFRDYLSSVLEKAQIEPVSLFLLGQYNYESQIQVDGILEKLALEDYASCQGLHDSQLTNDVIVIYVAVAKDHCKILVVLDPVGLFDHPYLLGSLPVQDGNRVLKHTVRKDF